MSADRIAALHELVAYHLPLDSTLAKLAAFGWDAPAPLLTLAASDVMRMLQRFSTGDISAEQLTDWADLIECREDIALPRQPVDISAVIFRLANPNLEGPVTPALVTELQARIAGGVGAV